MKDAFYKNVKNLRSYIMKGGTDYAHEELDSLVQTVTKGGGFMSKEQSLQEDVANVIKRIRAAKEDEELKEQANKFIKQIKDELDK